MEGPMWGAGALWGGMGGSAEVDAENRSDARDC